MRPSGNAPEFHCDNEANSEERVQEMQNISMEILLKLKGCTALFKPHPADKIRINKYR